MRLLPCVSYGKEPEPAGTSASDGCTAIRWPSFHGCRAEHRAIAGSGREEEWAVYLKLDGVLDRLVRDAEARLAWYAGQSL